MRRVIWWTAGVLVAVLLVAQLVRPARTNPPVGTTVPAPPDVEALLRRACWDCHSNETLWPWYAQVAPLSWLVVHDVDEGREHANYTAWERVAPKRRRKLLGETRKEVAEGEMPPWYYVLMHPEARLSESEQARLFAWATEAERQVDAAASGPSGGSPAPGTGAP